MTTWYIQRGPETVKIYDRVDGNGYGNIRFSGTLESALTHLAITMQSLDEVRSANKDLNEQITQLKTQMMR